MKTYWWKIGLAAVLVLAAVITARVFWSRPSESSITESPARANQQQTQQNRPRPSAKELYQTALLHKEPADSAHRDLWLVVAYCRRIQREYPDSPQAEKAKKLLEEMPERHQEMSFPRTGKPKVKRSRPLRRRIPMRYERQPYIIIEETEP